MTPPRLLRLDITARLIGAILAGALLSACSSSGGGSPSAGGGPTPAPDAFPVVATTTVLADLVRQVGGSRVRVTSLVPPGGEVHTFDPTPADIARVADAKLLVINGLGLDDWAADVARDSGSRAPLVALGEDLDGVDYLAGDEEHGDAVNPHLWLNVAYAVKYVERIGARLAEADPAHAADYDAGTAAYIERLRELDSWAAQEIETVPADRQKIVSFHEAFPYFAAAYGLDIVGTVVEVPGQDPSAGEIAALVDAIRASGASAVFSEAQFNPGLAETIAREAGVPVESRLYNDSLGDPPADTYEGMIRWDVERVVDAIRP